MASRDGSSRTSASTNRLTWRMHRRSRQHSNLLHFGVRCRAGACAGSQAHMEIFAATIAALAISAALAFRICRISSRSAKDRTARAARIRSVSAAIAFVLVAVAGLWAAYPRADADSSSTDAVVVVFIPLYAFIAGVAVDALAKTIQNARVRSRRA